MEEDLDIEHMGEILENIPKLVTKDQNRNLMAPFFDVEIKHSLFSMAPNKAPGINGFPADFF